MGINRNITDPYSRFESWAYDRFIAPAAAQLTGALGDYVPAALRSATARVDVLDVGCGGGQIAVMFAERYRHAHITGVDLSSEQVARAVARTRALRERFSWQQGSALSLPFDDDRFDLAYSIASIKHWPDPAQGVAEMVRVTKPGGSIMIAEADRGCRFEDAKQFVALWSIPRLIRPLGLALFRTWVAGQSLSVDEARGFWDGLPVCEASVERIPGAPVFLMRATVQ